MRIQSKMVSENPNMSEPNWKADHYKCTLTHAPGGARRQMTVYFSQGLGICADPTAEGVLYCLLSDASVEDARSFEEWASDLGYDPDSRTAERTYQTCLKQTQRLRTFLGDTWDTWVKRLEDY